MRNGSFDSPKWIPEAEYEEIVKKLPILCVDVLPIRPGPDRQVGLMLRDTYWNRRRWCLVGGGVRHGEPVREAVERVFVEALGDEVKLDFDTLVLRDVVEYFPEPGTERFFDPRKHAVALTYVCVMSGSTSPRGKAFDFRWFSPDSLPEDHLLGFGQERLIPRLLGDVGWVAPPPHW